MGRWISGTGRWQDCHFVLTRSGFLHWLLNAGQPSHAPADGWLLQEQVLILLLPDAEGVPCAR